MPPVAIENPIINSPFAEPSRHFRFDDENSITNEIVEGRRPSTAIVPVARPRASKNDPQQMLPGDFSQDRAEPNKLVNDIRLHVGRWRQGGQAGITATTRRLLDYWTDPSRDAYFTGKDQPYEKLKRALRAEIDEAAWASLYRTTSRAFPRPLATSTNKEPRIAIKVINHYGDEVLKVFPIK